MNREELKLLFKKYNPEKWGETHRERELKYISWLEEKVLYLLSKEKEYFCQCLQGKGVDLDEDGFPYCIDCQKNITVDSPSKD